MSESVAPDVGRRTGLGSRTAGAPRTIPFAELAHLHYEWRRSLDGTHPDSDARAKRYERCRAAFEAERGTIVNEYWCWNVPSAVALTEKPRPAPISWFLRPRLAFHRASDWATKDEPDIAEQVHRCDTVAIRASQVLSGLRRRICLQLVMTSAAHLLSFVDSKAMHATPADVLKQEKVALDATEAYYRDAANGQAQIVYFAAMFTTAAALGLFALFGSWWIPLPGIEEDREFYSCIAAGALGAVVSVIQRINAGQFSLTFDVGRPYISFLGALRAVLGATFGLLLYFAVTSGLLTIFNVPDESPQRLFSFLVIAFLAGFSERWAQDTLTALGQGSGQTDPAAPPPTQGTART
jgi:hypothetical protein